MKNVYEPPLSVRHAELRRVSDDSRFRSYCPACGDGFLPVQRDAHTHALISHDQCIQCGQVVNYEDELIGGEPVTRLTKETP